MVSAEARANASWPSLSRISRIAGSCFDFVPSSLRSAPAKGEEHRQQGDATNTQTQERRALGRKRDEGECARGRPHDEVQPGLANTLRNADDALLLAATDRLHHQTCDRVGDAVREGL